jgi:hopene-associated glycosyltransferase HpnB
MMLAALACLLVWLGLLLFWHGYWRHFPQLPKSEQHDATVAIIVPARDEAETIATVVTHLFAQDYRGKRSVTVVNDSSSDDTALLARKAGAQVIDAPPLPPGWSGKLWALQQGVAAHPDADLYWFSDADIVHEAGTLPHMAAQMQQHDLVSVMAHLRCSGFWERLLVPAFIHFFMMLYPFRAVNDPQSCIAGAAGGSILIRRTLLEKIGGIAAYRDALIDDCTLARHAKRAGGRLWLGFSDGTQSLRQSFSLSPLWAMVRRSAFNQLGHSYLLLTGTVLGLGFLFLLPVAILLSLAKPPVLLLALACWALISLSFLPTLRHHKLGLWRAPSLPFIAALYLLMTLDSARMHALGKGGAWKGRLHKPESRPS